MSDPRKEPKGQGGDPGGPGLGMDPRDLRRRAEAEALSGEQPEAEAMSPETTLHALHELRVHQIELEMQNEELRRTHAEVDLSRARYFDLYDLAPVGYFTMDGEGRIMEANLTAASMLGLARGELAGRLLSRFIDPLDQDLYYRHHKALMETGKPQVSELRVLAGTDLQTWMRLEASFAVDAAGSQVCRAVMSDIGELKRAESSLRDWNETLERRVEERTAELARSDERFRLALRLAGIEVAEFDPEFRYRWVWAPDSGFDQSGTAGRRIDEVNPGPEADRFLEFQRTVVKSGAWASSEMTFDRGGSHRIYTVIAEPLRDSAGKISGLLTAMMDVTEKRRLEEKISNAQKMEAVGRLAGGVAHDFNNMMQVQMGFAGRMLRELTPTHPFHDDVEGIRKTAERASDLTMKLLAFGRKQVLKPLVLDMNRLVSDALPLLHRIMGEDVEIVTILQPGLGRVMADPESLEQVLVNLGLNARDAMPRGGTLALETSDIEIDEGPTLSETGLPPGRYVRLCASDTGNGMDRETMANIFEPFFSTKAPGKGTGLGLAMVYGTISQSGGALQVFSEPGKGSMFEISLPRVEADLQPVKAIKTSQFATGGNETILLVEDDNEVRGMISLELEDLGYKVIQARDRLTAVECSKGYSGPIQLLLTDVILASSNGREVAEYISANRPGIRTLYISGHTEAHIVRRGILIPGTQFLQKPFSTEQLDSKIRETLES